MVAAQCWPGKRRTVLSEKCWSRNQSSLAGALSRASIPRPPTGGQSGSLDIGTVSVAAVGGKKKAPTNALALCKTPRAVRARVAAGRETGTGIGAEAKRARGASCRQRVCGATHVRRSIHRVPPRYPDTFQRGGLARAPALSVARCPRGASAAESK